ncbi:MAG: hypothetical protein AVDCRST_MAG12-1563, partial [uncultured Rubrobacteraceae bacterium]
EGQAPSTGAAGGAPRTDGSRQGTQGPRGPRVGGAPVRRDAHRPILRERVSRRVAV